MQFSIVNQNDWIKWKQRKKKKLKIYNNTKIKKLIVLIDNQTIIRFSANQFDQSMFKNIMIENKNLKKAKVKMKFHWISIHIEVQRNETTNTTIKLITNWKCIRNNVSSKRTNEKNNQIVETNRRHTSQSVCKKSFFSIDVATSIRKNILNKQKIVLLYKIVRWTFSCLFEKQKSIEFDDDFTKKLNFDKSIAISVTS